MKKFIVVKNQGQVIRREGEVSLHCLLLQEGDEAIATGFVDEYLEQDIITRVEKNLEEVEGVLR